MLGKPHTGHNQIMAAVICLPMTHRIQTSHGVVAGQLIDKQGRQYGRARGRGPGNGRGQRKKVHCKRKGPAGHDKRLAACNRH
jgi:hypothetical protein